MGIGILCRKKEPLAALELRIHGVHGTSPGSMLGVKDVSQVAGDGLTGVFRSDGDLPLRTVRKGHAVEAYSWGALTSSVRGVFGWVQRALWMLLLPFALVNLAYWARLHVGEDDRTGRWGATTVRWVALLLTMWFVLAVSVVAIDLVAWQCYRGGTKSCDVLPGALDFMMKLAPSQRIAVASILPLGAVALLWVLSRQSLARYEATQDSDRPGVPAPAVEPEGPQHLLQRPEFWISKGRTRRLQRLHLAGAVATVMAFIGVQVDRRADVTVGVWTVIAAVLIVLVVLSLMLAQPEDLEHRPEKWHPGARLASRLDLVLVFVAPALAITQALVLFFGPSAVNSRLWNEDSGWRGHNAWFIGIFVLLTVLNTAVFAAGRMKARWAVFTIVVFTAMTFAVALVSLEDSGSGLGLTDDTTVLAGLLGSLAFAAAFLLGLLFWHLRRRRTHPSAAWHGAGAAVLVGASAWVALLFTTATVTAAAEYLNGPDQSVADLTSQYDSVKAATRTESVTGEQADPNVYVGKDVVLRGAVLVEGNPPVLVRGTVQSSAASVNRKSPIPRTQGLPDTVLETATLVLEDDRVGLVDSCLLATTPPDPQDPPSCHPESTGFVTAATVAVTDARITVAAPGQRVRLEVGDPPQTPLVIPQVLIWVPITQVLWLLLVIAVVVVCFVRLWRKVRPEIARQVDADDRVPPDSKAASRRRRFSAALAHRAERTLDLVGAITVLAVLALLVVTAFGRPPWGLLSDFGDKSVADLAHPLATISLYAVLALSAGLIALGSYFRRSESARKAVGVIWDLTTFWPRAAHPLSPPCYAERVVPEMTTRIRWALERDPASLVVVSGHSQGSLIAAATLMRLEDPELERIRFITYGSQIRALYGRVFPSVFGPAVIGYQATPPAPRFGEAFPDVVMSTDQKHALWRVGATVPQPPATPPVGSLRARLGAGRWINLFRRTDPLGWRVFSDLDSAWDVPTAEVPPRIAGDPGPPVMTHSGYPHSQEYREHVCGWLGEDVVHNDTWAIGDVKPLPHL